VRESIAFVLEDGTYEALIVDATPDDSGDGSLHLEVTITTGVHKGEVVLLRGRFAGRDELDLLAVPATLVVSDGQPSLRLDA
jgi:hypothetical protein